MDHLKNENVFLSNPIYTQKYTKDSLKTNTFNLFPHKIKDTENTITLVDRERFQLQSTVST